MEERLEDVVHKSLECCGRIRQAKGHHQELKMTMVGAKSCFSNVIRVYSDLMIASSEVQFGKEACSMEFIKQFFHYRDWELILDSLVIEGPIVDAESPRPITLLH